MDRKSKLDPIFKETPNRFKNFLDLEYGYFFIDWTLDKVTIFFNFMSLKIFFIRSRDS